MKHRRWLRVPIVLAVVVTLGACREYPTKPASWLADHNPVISWAVAFPQLIGQGDSVMVTVSATDPDGDTLVYDWVTDARLDIKGGDIGYDLLSNSYSNSIILYRTTVPPINANDTAWVRCGVRDRRGGGAVGLVLVPLRN